MLWSEEPPATKDGRRTGLHLQAAIIEALISELATLNRITYLVNVNRVRAKKHLDELVRKGFVEPSRGNRARYSATKAGRDWLAQFRKVE